MIEFFFDCSSPWTYLAFENIDRLSKELDTPISWRPFLVGGVFNTVNPSVYVLRQNEASPKLLYMHKDIQDWARLQKLDILFPPSVFPVNSVKAMRACCVLGQECVPFARRAFEAYFGEDRDISQDDVLQSIAEELSIDWPNLKEQLSSDAIKAQLRANTDELIARGGFGSPTMFVDGDDMYFGNDRMGLIREAVLRRKA